MKEVITKWTLGNFSVELTAEANEHLQEKLLALGLRFLGQRVSEVDKVLGGFEKGTDGKLKRKPGFRRGEVPFSDELASALKPCFEELTLPDDSKMLAKVSVSAYVPEVGAAPKFKEEREIVGRHESKGDLDEWLAKVVDFDGPTHTVNGEDYSPGMLSAVKAWKVEMLKSM